MEDPPVETLEPLADDFPAASHAEWEKLVRAKAKDPDAPLITELEDGIEVSWLYTADDAIAPDPGGKPGADPFVRGTRIGRRWEIRQQTSASDRETANAQILEDLEGGATEILLALDPEGKKGIPIADVDQLDEVLDGVYLDMAPVALEAGPHTSVVAKLLIELWRRREHPADELRGALRLDPIGTLASTGADAELSSHIAEAVGLAGKLRSELPNVQALAVDTGAYVDAGAGTVPELALAIATGIAYLRAGEEAGIDPAQLAETLELTLVAGPDQFLELAKLRAARRLWSTVLERCDVPEDRRHSRLYVRTSRRMASALDPWNNMLRATTAAFAAGVGGADGITVLPFDEPVGNPGALGRRMARNTQLVLQEEGQLYRVADPAGGSWYVESLTQQLAQAAWSRLQQIERDGGIVGALGSGSIASQLAKDTARRHDELARRRRGLTGVNTFPLLGDDGLERTEQLDTTEGVEEMAQGNRLIPVRDGAPFEELRARALGLAKSGTEPRILLACMGPLSAHVNIALWAKNFFEAGGIETISSGIQPDDDAQAAQLSEHGLRFAAICPGKDAADDDKRSLIEALREAGAEAVYVAGASQDGTEKIGADVGVRDGVDMVAVLGELLDRFESEGATR